MDILNDEEKQLILESFAQVAPDADKVAQLFYQRLFEIAPSVQHLFSETDMPEQQRKLMQTLGTVVGAVYNWGNIVPQIKALGKRHINYGAEIEHYRLVGEALIWSLQQSLEERFTSEVEAAWLKMYGALVEIIKEAYLEKSAQISK